VKSSRLLEHPDDSLSRPVDGHEASIRRLLDEVEAASDHSQRSLSSRLGIALGLTNLLLKRVVNQGWVRVTHIRPNRVRYLITPAGIAEKARMTRKYLSYSVGFYFEARERIGARLAQLSSTWPAPGAEQKRIVFWGGGEAAEIAFVCLQETDLRLVAVIDDARTKPFFQVPVYPASTLRAGAVNGVHFDCVVVTLFGEPGVTQEGLDEAGVDANRVCWL
jgi:ribosomal protein S25